MRHVIGAVFVLGCSFTKHPGGSLDDGDVDAPPMLDDAGREIVTWDIDTAPAFARAGSTLLDMSVEPWGSLSPAGYFYGVAVGRGATTAAFDATTPDNLLVWQPQNTVAIGGWDARFADSSHILDQFGVAGAPLTLWIEGEILLPADPILLHLRGNDVAFLEIAPPRTTQFQRIAVSRGGIEEMQPYNAASAGWHPFRIGWASSTTQLHLGLAYTPIAAVRRDFDRATMRGRGDALRGFARAVSGHQLLADGHPVFAFPGTDGIADTFTTAPPGAPPDNLRWSARYAGQLYAQVAGDYAIQIASDDGHRLLSGATVVNASWALDQIAAPTDTTTVAMSRGWNDIVVDYNQVDGARGLALGITAAPAPDPIAGAIPLARLRPVEPRSERLAYGDDTVAHIFQDNNATYTPVTVRLRGTPGEVIEAIDIGAIITSGRHEDLDLRLTAPNGQTTTITNNGLAPGSGVRTYTFPITDAALLGSPIDGNWVLGIRDDQAGANGPSQLDASYITLRTSNGHDQIARKSEWISEIVDNPTGIAQFDDIRWTSRDTGLPAIVQLRSCDAPCSAEPWVSQTSGTAPAIAPKRYLQAHVELGSNGVASPEFEQLVITYRRNPK